MATLVYPDGKTVRYTYDLAGQLTTVTDWAGRVTRYTYDENYRLIRTERPNGTVELRHYDAAGQLLRLWDQNAQGVMLQQYRFVYNELGQIIQEEEKQYTYDALRRLTSGAMAGRKILYTYDQGGNITAIGDSGSSLATTMTYAKDNRLDTVDGQHVQYDEDGNLLLLPGKQQSETYAYDARNRLVRAGQARYTYDAEYVRTSMTWNGKTTRYVVDQNADLTQVLMELEENGAAKAYYVYGMGLIGREDAQGDYLSYHADTRGSTTLLTDEHGRVTDRYTYGLYGELEAHEGRTKQPFCYNGRDGVMTDPNGLYYMRARYYHPGLKRFLNRDVLQGDMTDGQTFNRFAYVNGDPIRYIDPLGLMKCKPVHTVGDGVRNVGENGQTKVYRVIRPEENPLNGLTAKKPDRAMTLEGHVSSGSRNKGSQFISTTTKIEIAEKWSEKSGNRIVEIDLEKLSQNVSVFDLSTETGRARYLKGSTAKRLAKGSSEVLIEGHIPSDAVKIIKP
uniref:RHS repeat domain-containing protein n=1 Tax=Brevibacillus formosus TaxID=54913 RepID=UPI002155BF56|nr:RHS repeat-associated core domain-containing protein [Brevibacillus formosus]